MRDALRPVTTAALFVICVVLAASYAFGQTPARVRVTKQATLWRVRFPTPIVVVDPGVELEVVARRGRWYEVVVPFLDPDHPEIGLIAVSQVEPISGALPITPPPAPAVEPFAAGRFARGPVAKSWWSRRVFIDINGAQQERTTTLSERGTFAASLEQGTFTSAYPVKKGSVLMLDGGVRLAGGLAASVGVSRFKSTQAAGITAEVPHPFFFDVMRSVTGVSPGLAHQEIAIDIDARWMSSAGRRIQIAVSGGPTVVVVTQDLVSRVTYSEAYPYDTATFTGVEFGKASKSGLGGNGAVDVTFLFSRSIGIGGTVRYARATVDFVGVDGSVLPAVVGGAQVGGGLRLRF